MFTSHVVTRLPGFSLIGMHSILLMFTNARFKIHQHGHQTADQEAWEILSDLHYISILTDLASETWLSEREEH